MNLYLDIDPPRTTAQQKGERVDRYGHIHHYMKASVRKAHDLLLRELLPARPDAPIEGPISLSCIWVFNRPRGEKAEYKTTRPDTDNLQKLLKDVMTECGYWLDDSQVVSELAVKMWSGNDGPYRKRGIYITYRKIREGAAAAGQKAEGGRKTEGTE